MKVGDHTVDQADQLGEQPPVVAEVGPQQLGDSESEYPVGQAQQQVLGQELGEQQRALLGA